MRHLCTAAVLAVAVSLASIAGEADMTEHVSPADVFEAGDDGSLPVPDAAA